jgi:hypothetical protein
MARSYPLEKIEMRHYLNWVKALFEQKKKKISEQTMVDIVEYCEFQPMYIQQFLFDLWRSPTFDSDALEKIKHSILISHQNQFMVL